VPDPVPRLARRQQGPLQVSVCPVTPLQVVADQQLGARRALGARCQRDSRGARVAGPGTPGQQRGWAAQGGAAGGGGGLHHCPVAAGCRRVLQLLRVHDAAVPALPPARTALGQPAHRRGCPSVAAPVLPGAHGEGRS
jgi:hypothetical protein